MSVHLVAGYPEITRPIGTQCRKCYYCYLFLKFQYKVGYMTLTYSVNINKQVTELIVCKLWRVLSVDCQMEIQRLLFDDNDSDDDISELDSDDNLSSSSSVDNNDDNNSSRCQRCQRRNCPLFC